MAAFECSRKPEAEMRGRTAVSRAVERYCTRSAAATERCGVIKQCIRSGTVNSTGTIDHCVSHAYVEMETPSQTTFLTPRGTVLRSTL